MNTTNKYQKWYNKLILYRKQHTPCCDYIEEHHIVPTCCNGPNTAENKVALTAREHYIAHVLLAKMQPNNLKLQQAVVMMQMSNRKQKRQFRFNSHIFENIRKHVVELNRIKLSGTGNPMYGSRYRWMTNIHTHKNARIAIDYIIPTELAKLGWTYGKYQSKCKQNSPRKKRHYKWIKNEQLQKSMQIAKDAQLTEDMVKAGWEYGQFITQSMKDAYAKAKPPFSIEKRKQLHDLFTNSRMIQNKQLKATRRLKQNEVLTEDMVKAGWEYGQYQSEKCQNMHKAREKLIMIDGIQKTVKEWAKTLNMSVSKLKSRLREGLKTVYDIINPPNPTYRNGGKRFEYNGKLYTLKELEILTGLKSTCINARLGRGWKLEDAVNPNITNTKKIWICNEAHHFEKLLRSTDPIPTGWQRGRLNRYA